MKREHAIRPMQMSAANTSLAFKEGH
ncbi:hypothetical protein AFERRI_10138 [Acidithiobacillus ferrivorans]|uniref:Uncharacterized protein n=1 Tax=Acidithiobacillus ferrivorans TaxID=160808 RepID=A0A060UV77_9PROT|nr:hypothetical protein AFERRI_10138 [Acidithiobacillus ferrivorans]